MADLVLKSCDDDIVQSFKGTLHLGKTQTASDSLWNHFFLKFLNVHFYSDLDDCLQLKIAWIKPISNKDKSRSTINRQIYKHKYSVVSAA